MLDLYATSIDYDPKHERSIAFNAGAVSHKQAMKKATRKYRTYQAKTLSPVETAYLESVKALQQDVEQRAKEQKSNRK